MPADYPVELRPPAQWAAPDAVETAWFTLPIAALYDGVARAARDWLARYTTERNSFRPWRSLSTLPRFQEAIGEIDGKLLSQPGFDPDRRRTDRLGQTARAFTKAGLSS